MCINFFFSYDFVSVESLYLLEIYGWVWKVFVLSDIRFKSSRVLFFSDINSDRKVSDLEDFLGWKIDYGEC